jgi:hypothetical protein
MLEMVESTWCAGVVPTIDRATSARRSSRRVRQRSLQRIAAHHCCLAGRAQMSDNVDRLRRALPTIDLAARAQWRRLSVRHRCVRYAFTYGCRVVGCAQMSDNVDALVRVALPTIDVAARARWRRRRVRQGCLRCTGTCCCRVVGRAQMSDNVDSFWRAVHYRPSMSLPVHGGAAAVCAKVAYDVPILAVVVWWDERRFRTMSTR